VRQAHKTGEIDFTSLVSLPSNLVCTVSRPDRVEAAREVIGLILRHARTGAGAAGRVFPDRAIRNRKYAAAGCWA
jgi:ribosomal protein L16/L10AE